jgi:hypothetical protein
MGKIKIPQGEIEAALRGMLANADGGISWETITGRNFAKNWCPLVIKILEAAHRWQMENPIVPSDEQVRECAGALDGPWWTWGEDCAVIRKFFAQWQGHMYLDDTPEVPEAIQDMIEAAESPKIGELIVEAFRRGQKAGQ